MLAKLKCLFADTYPNLLANKDEAMTVDILTK